MKFAAFSGVFMDRSIFEALEITKQLGLDGLEIAGRAPHLAPIDTLTKVKEIKEKADYLGLEIPVLASYTGGFSTLSDAECDETFEDFKKMLEFASILGAAAIRVTPGGPNAFLAADYHYSKAAFWLDKCAAEAKNAGLDIIIEIHNNSLAETTESSLRLLNMIRHQNIGMIHDAGNMYITDTTYGEESVFALGDRLFHVHIKDERRISANSDMDHSVILSSHPGSFVNLTRHGQECFVPCLLGQGEADHEPLFTGLLESGYEGWVTLECHAPNPPHERMEHDFAKVKAIIEQLQ